MMMIVYRGTEDKAAYSHLLAGSPHTGVVIKGREGRGIVTLIR